MKFLNVKLKIIIKYVVCATNPIDVLV
jgi:hypothetical protein